MKTCKRCGKEFKPTDIKYLANELGQTVAYCSEECKKGKKD